MARPTASAAAHGAGPNNLTMSSPTNVETRCPPIRARGCAGSAFGEPSTVTIDVAKGIATSGKAALAENASMPAIATAPPAAPAKIASNLVLSHMPPETMQLLEQHGECPRWNPNTGHVDAFLPKGRSSKFLADVQAGLRCARSPTGVRDSHASTLNIDLLAPSRSQTATVASRSSTNPVSIDCCNVQVGRVGPSAELSNCEKRNATRQTRPSAGVDPAF